MAVTRIEDVVVPEEFTSYVVQNSVVKTALAEAGVAVRNAVITTQLSAGADSFTIPHWLDLPDDEADIVNDDPAVNSVPRKLGSGKQVVRKSFLHSSWSAMNLASELSGDDALQRIRSRVTAYWDRQFQSRLIASLNGILASNRDNNSSDMVIDISTETGAAAVFSASAVIAAGLTLGDRIDDLKAIAVHSDIYGTMLNQDLIEFIPDSKGGLIRTYRGLAITVDDGLPVSIGGDVYTSVLFGSGAVGFGMTAPRIAAGTEIENLPSAGRGGGQQILHSRVNLAIHPLGFQWLEGTVALESPSIAELALTENWFRVVERKAAPLAFLVARAAEAT